MLDGGQVRAAKRLEGHTLHFVVACAKSEVPLCGVDSLAIKRTPVEVYRTLEQRYLISCTTALYSLLLRVMVASLGFGLAFSSIVELLNVCAWGVEVALVTRSVHARIYVDRKSYCDKVRIVC